MAINNIIPYNFIAIFIMGYDILVIDGNIWTIKTALYTDRRTDPNIAMNILNPCSLVQLTNTVMFSPVITTFVSDKLKMQKTGKCFL